MSLASWDARRMDSDRMDFGLGMLAGALVMAVAGLVALAARVLGDRSDAVDELRGRVDALERRVRDTECGHKSGWCIPVAVPNAVDCAAATDIE